MRQEYDPAWPSRSADLHKGIEVGTRENGGMTVFPYQRVVNMPLSRTTDMISAKTKKLPTSATERILPSGSCKVWHISLHELRSVECARHQAVPQSDSSHGDCNSKSVLDYRNDLWHIVTRINTDFDLKGPSGCDKEFLKQSLFDVAHILVHEDRTSLMQVCEWFKDAFPGQFEGCGNSISPQLIKKLPIDIKPIQHGRGGYDVSCK